MPRMLAAVAPYSIVESNLRHAMRFYAGCSAGGGVDSGACMELTRCGFDYPIFNSALLAAEAPLDAAALRRGITYAEDHFLRHQVGWSCWFCHDLLTREASATLATACTGQGLSFVLSAPGLLAPELRIPPRWRMPKGLRIEPVRDEASRVALAHMISIIFDLPFATTANIYGSARAWNEEFAAFLGYSNDAPAAVAMINRHNGSCGFYSVGTAPEFRRKGYGTAMMLHAAAFAKTNWKSGCYVLQSTTAGRRLYEKLGFQAVTQFSVYRAPAEK